MKLKLFAPILGLCCSLLMIQCEEDEPAQPPVISSFAPESALPGENVIITGTNFSETPSENVVTFNGMPAEVISSTKTQISTTVPANATTGKIAVTVKEKTATSANDFTVKHLPAIASFTPATEYANGVVTITGTHFSTVPAENIVKFNGVTATVTASTETSITTSVPADATTGTISVTVNGHTATTANNFTVLHAPVINSFNPSSGMPVTSTGFAGEIVTIIGNHFSTVTAENTVKFNSTAATVLTASATQLTVEVPSGATTGKVSVTVNNKEALSSGDFSVTPTNVWTVVNNTHDALLRSNAIAFSIGSKIYFGLGQNASNADLKDFWEYNIETGQFTQRKDFGGSARNGATGFAIGNKGYVCAGFHTGTTYADMWEYDPSTDNWTQKTNFPGTPRSGAVGFSIGSKGYFGTGYASLNYLPDFWEFDPAGNDGAGSWAQKADVGIGVAGRTGASRFVINSKGYIGGGTSNGNRKDFWEYAPDGWTSTAEPGIQSFVSTGFSFAIGSKGFAQAAGTQLWMFDPATNQWTRKADLPASLASVGVSVGNAGYIVGGSSTTRTFYRYVPN